MSLTGAIHTIDLDHTGALIAFGVVMWRLAIWRPALRSIDRSSSVFGGSPPGRTCPRAEGLLYGDG